MECRSFSDYPFSYLLDDMYWQKSYAPDVGGETNIPDRFFFSVSTSIPYLAWCLRKNAPWWRRPKK